VVESLPRLNPRMKKKKKIKYVHKDVSKNTPLRVSYNIEERAKTTKSSALEG
jgi:hypothetical protein